MSGTERPGGLTALGALGLLFGIMALTAPLSFMTMRNVPEDVEFDDPAQQAQFDAYREVSDGVIWTLSAAALIQGVMYIISATGLFKLKRVRGYLLANACAVFSIAAVFLNFALLPDDVNEGRLNLVSLWHFVFPCLNLYLLNFVFREDLVR